MGGTWRATSATFGLLVQIGSASMILPGQLAGAARVVLLGTGTPIPDSQRSGPSVAVVANGQSYLFDAGPGVVRRALQAAEANGIAALEPTRLDRVFITHLHTDHTLGLPDLLFTPWVVGRFGTLEVYGPKGIAAMVQHLREAYSADIAVRTEGLEHLPSAGPPVNVHEIETAGSIYQDVNVSIQAVAVKHGSWPQAFGYVVQAADRRIVISGDTVATAAIAEACNGCDVLVHEVYSSARFALLNPGAQRYHSSFHTSARELAELGAKAKPKLLVLYHQLFFGPEQGVDLEKEIRQTYSGAVVNGKDLGVY